MITKSTKKEQILKLAKDCKQCGHCCKVSAGFVLKDEINELAKKFKTTKEQFIKKYLDETTIFNNVVYKFRTTKKPIGQCILYKNGCTIHTFKPLHCRIGNCNKHGEELSAWFTVNHLLNIYDPESVRQFHMYEKKGGKTLKKGTLKEMFKDKKLLKKILNYEVLR